MTHDLYAILGIQSDSPLAQTLQQRADILAQTQTTLDAVLKPKTCGIFDPQQRLALACRIARLHQDTALAEHFAQQVTDPLPLADPSIADFPDAITQAVARHTDLVSRQPKEASQADVAALLTAGVTEADVVRLSEIIAFLNYYVRLVAGLRLLQQEQTS